jgi:hypothetical protein
MEDEARGADKPVCVSKRAPANQQEAINLYERMGFRQRGRSARIGNACPQYRDEPLFREVRSPV